MYFQLMQILESRFRSEGDFLCHDGSEIAVGPSLFMKQEFTFVKVLIATNKCHVKKR